MKDDNENERAGQRGEVVGSWKRRGLSADVEIPVGLERLLLLAAGEPAFRERLLADPAAAAAERQIALSASEQATLAAMPRSVLAAMVTRLTPGRQKNTRLVTKVAAAVAGTALVAASCYACGGVDPDYADAPLSDAATDAGAPDGPPIVDDGPAESADAATDTDAAPSADAGTPDAT